MSRPEITPYTKSNFPQVQKVEGREHGDSAPRARLPETARE